MTLVDVKNALFSFFMNEESSVFNVKEDLAAITLELPKDHPLASAKEALVKAALDDFVRTGVLAEVGDGVYILTQPIGMFVQPVGLSPIAAEMVADLVNDVYQSGDEKRFANKLAITSQDIETLCHYCYFLLDEGMTSDQNP